MRKAILLTATLICAVLGLLACKATDEIPGRKGSAQSASATTARAGDNANTATPTTPPADPGDGVRRITIAELQAAMDKNEALIVDVRGQDAYDGGHIKGSILITADQIDKNLDKLPKDKLIVFYCA